MRYFILAACLFLGSPVTFADNTAPHVGSLFSYNEWKEIYSTRRCPEDFMVLADGSKLCGTIEKLPSIEYSFGSLDFDADRIAAISIAPYGKLYRVQYISRDGQNFIGVLAKGKFSMWVNEPNAKDPHYLVKKDIDPKIVTFVLLKDRKRHDSIPNPKISTIELKNGDHLPAIIKTDPIVLSNGWKEKKLNPDHIVELCFNGGLHGQVIENGKPIDLGFMFVKDRFLTIQVPNLGQTIRLPWDQIEGIQAKNGGFKRDPNAPLSKLTTQPIIDDLEEALQSGVQTTACDEIGRTRGTLLAQAFGGIPLPPSAFNGLELLGLEKLWVPEPLFKHETEEDWLMQIAFEEVIKVSPPQETSLDPDDVYLVQETLVAESIPTVDVDPVVFNFDTQEGEVMNKNLLTNEFSLYSFEDHQPRLTPEAQAYIDEILAEDEDDLSFPLLAEEEMDEVLLTPEALAIIEEILDDDELDDVLTLTPPKLTEEVTFAMLPKEKERAEESLGQEDLIWSDVKIDENTELTKEERELLDELFTLNDH